MRHLLVRVAIGGCAGVLVALIVAFAALRTGAW